MMIRDVITETLNLFKKNKKTEETVRPKEEVKIGEGESKVEERSKPKKTTKRKTLGNDFQKLVDSKDDEEIIKFLKRCEVDACGGAPIRSALGFDVSETVMSWLVEQGADVNFTNSYGATPLHHHAGMRTGNVKCLLELGANINAKDKMGNTPLSEAVSAFQFENVKTLVEAGADINVIVRDESLISLALKRTSNINIPACEKIVGYLLDKDVKLTGEEAKEVTRIGNDLEFYYDRINPELVGELEAGLNRLFGLFKVPPVPKRKKQALGKTISVTAATWQKQHNELWNLLVPAQNHANTLQGEIIRISGKLSYEILDNGRMNWDKEYVEMTHSMLDYMKQGKFEEDDLKECSSLLKQVREDKADETEMERLCELSVKWVLQNAMPITLDQVTYKR